MRVLLTGANGFLGAQVTAALLAAGHSVTGAVRNPASFRRRFPSASAVLIDMNRDVHSEDWLEKLTGIDAVINCAGILQGGYGQSAAAIHAASSIALFDACAACGIKKIIQISAISADSKAGTPYALTKLQADDHLRGLDVDWTVLRPSLVYAEGSHGGTSLLRALAAMPWFIPVVGKGGQEFQPIHGYDFARAVVTCLDSPSCVRQTLDVAGLEILTFTAIVIKLRA